MLPDQYLEIYELKQKDLAEALGIRPSTLSNYLSGARKPPLQIVQKVERITKGKITIDDWIKLWQRNNEKK
jgi:transcriptional regulator with XRE-family HTH domain